MKKKIYIKPCASLSTIIIEECVANSSIASFYPANEDNIPLIEDWTEERSSKDLIFNQQL